MVFPFIKRRFKHTSGGQAADIYGFHPARVFTNGGLQYTFEFHKTLPLFSPIGPATAAGMLMVNQGPQVVSPLSVPTSGLGGLQAGTLVSQPLVNSDYSPVE